MASTTSPEASEIRRRGRRRLLGAVTLVLLAVVFIPMILDNEPRPQRAEPSLTIPPKENAPPLPAPTPASKAPPAATPAPQATAPQAAPDSSSRTPQAPPDSSSRTPQSGSGPGPNAAPAKAEPAPPAAKVEPVAKPQPPAAKAAGKAPPKLEGFAVQVGAFRDEARLQQARAKLEAAGIAHYTERIDASGGAMTRLRAGPFHTREAAEKARAKLQEGQVVPLP